MTHAAFRLQFLTGDGMADEKAMEPKILRSTEEENTPIDTTSAEPLRKAEIKEPNEEVVIKEPNPPRTTREFEPGQERN